MTVSIIGSDSTFIVILVPLGPAPKNSGVVVEITSWGWSMLSKVTGLSVALLSPPDKSNSPDGIDSSTELSGKFTSAFGKVIFETVFVRKSYVCPRVMLGVGLAAFGVTCAVDTPSAPPWTKISITVLLLSSAANVDRFLLLA